MEERRDEIVWVIWGVVRGVVDGLGGGERDVRREVTGGRGLVVGGGVWGVDVWGGGWCLRSVEREMD